MNNTSTPKITVITVVYNSLQSLMITAQNVQQQDYNAFEYWIIDGGSTDGTLPWLQQTQIHYISEPDKGIYDAMNKGVRLARGEWIIFMNAGDYFVSSHTLSMIAHQLPNYPAFIYGDIFTLRHDVCVYKKAHRAGNCHRMFCCHQTIVAHQSLLIKHPFVLNHPYSADLFWLKTMCSIHIPMHYIPQALIYYDLNGVSNQRHIASLKDNVAVIKELDTGWTRYWFLLRLYFVIIRDYIQGKK